jgi:hypothetical protein
MTRLTASCACILLALPLAASADPWTITSRTTGMADPNAIVLGHLDIDDFDNVQGGPLPYEMRISTLFDPTEPDAWGRATDDTAGIWLYFRIGDAEFYFTGEGRSTVQATLDGYYSHEVGLRNGSYVLSLANILQAPAGALGADAFTPLQLDSGDELSGAMRIDSYPANPDAPGFWSMSASGEFASLNVLSPVPEPLPLAMLATGLFGVGLRMGWRGRNTAHH